MLLSPSHSVAKTLQANGACIGLLFTPKIILKRLYNNTLYKNILKRIDREVKDKVITEELSEMLKHIARDERFKEIIIKEGKVWCNGR
jgi:disulfide oxidoreductase YuzD